MNRPDNCIMVIIGGSGDLTKRKLMPSLFNLYQNGRLPLNFAIVGIGTTKLSDDSFRDKMSESVNAYLKIPQVDQTRLTEFLGHLSYFPMDITMPDNFVGLKDMLTSLDKKIEANGNYIYYLATEPSHYEAIAENLGFQGLQNQNNAQSWKRIVVEKPFGHDLLSAQVLNRKFQSIFQESQIFRIDHYLGKETVQNILAFRLANGIFEPLWNRNYIHSVEITAAENMGVENRGRYYEETGALRDMVQNHLLQVMATIAMEPPSRFEANTIRDEKAKVFQSLCPIRSEDVSAQAVRGQYLSANIRGDVVAGYRGEKNVSADSKTETFVALKLGIDNWRWGGVPFYIRTGKRLPTRVTEAVIHFKKSPHHLFVRDGSSDIAENQLVLRIQPDEGVLLKFGLKLPGAGFEIKTVNMDFHYSELGEINLPDAYERLLLDCMLGDATLYARADAIEACWAFLTPILQTWQDNPDIKLYGYPAGTWGPIEANNLFEEPGEDWRYPCKNLSNDDKYCEL